MKHAFDVIFQTHYDVGRQVDLPGVQALFPKARQELWEKGRDTPESLKLPLPLKVALGEWNSKDLVLTQTPLRHLELWAKVYEEGVLTMECLLRTHIKLQDLHTLKHIPLTWQGRSLTPDQFSAWHFEQLLEKIRPLVLQDQYPFNPLEKEHYRIFCLTETLKNPQDFVKNHEDYLAPFLLGENPQESLHGSQVQATLQNPFSFRQDDLAIFDLNRAFLISPRKDYQDLLQIIEHANYQLLELRTLDTLLDRWLEDAEKAFRQGSSSRNTFFNRARAGRLGSLHQKFSRLQSLRLDALFLLENLENSSRIIGDYYLVQIYDHLCQLFNTQGWKVNVEKRLEILQNIYTTTKSDKNERTLVVLEFVVVLLIGVEIIALFFPLH